MSDLIPAAPGWYLKADADLTPVVAWQPGTQYTSDGVAPAVLLPYIANGPGLAPSLVPAESFERVEWEVVYLPNYDPGSPDE
ncbi:hypothetical protein QNO09_12835 [Streptomyces sp. 378]|uniref:hypothetical protein n=1 Tax=Streptomyces sp. 378 TaxID=3049412 RepID=UPI0024C29A2F|nr:hypothetical protein [Streptomyces sp. 378]MDK1344172.1 hypothetical protein [Streptomyces sp. 378]